MHLQLTKVYCIIPQYTLSCMFRFTYAILRENLEQMISQSTTRIRTPLCLILPLQFHLKLNFHCHYHIVIRVNLTDGQIHTAEKTSFRKTETFQKNNMWHFMT